MIDVTDLTRTFGRVVAADGVSFHVAPGEALALWGPNGAGKTTIIRCILGLLSYSGRITVAGHDARRQGKACRRAIGYVPQEPGLPADLRVTEVLSFFAALKRAGRGRPREVLGRIGLAEHARKRVSELSGGMRQRLVLGVAMLADPPILILDELTAGLDRQARGAFLTMLADLKAGGKTLLFACHRIGEVQRLADRVLGLDAGRCLFDVDPGRLAAVTGRRYVLKLAVAAEAVDRALAVLRECRFVAGRNGAGLLVEVPADAKAAPLEALTRARIAVRDFELIEECPAGDAAGTGEFDA